MKSKFKFFGLGIVLFIFFGLNSCSKEESTSGVNKNVENQKSQSILALLEAQTKTRISQNSRTGIWTVVYGKTEMKVEIIDSVKCIISGDFLRGYEIGLKYSVQNGVELFDKTFSHSISTGDFLSVIHDDGEHYNLVAPCDDHPLNQNFDSCVVMEIDKFCDGFIGCAAIIFAPLPVMAVIVGHCAACT
jgi:hypothetical protein